MIYDEFSGSEGEEEPPIKTKRRKLKAPKDKLHSDIDIRVGKHL